MAKELEFDIFDINRTTYQNEYTDPHQKQRTLPSRDRTTDKAAKPSPPPEYRDYETIQVKTRGQLGPFDKHGVPKPVIRIHPHQPLFYEEPWPVDDSCRKWRPRVVMSPAVSLDDADTLLGGDSETRELLMKFTYTSTQQQANKEAALPVPPPYYTPTTVAEPSVDQVRLVQEEFPPLPLGWKAVAKDWDKLQSRNGEDVTKRFWERYAPYVRCACLDPNLHMVTDDTVREITRLVRADKLRQAYMVPLPTYKGHMPECASGVPLERLPMDIGDPRMTVNQAYAARFTADNQCKK